MSCRAATAGGGSPAVDHGLANGTDRSTETPSQQVTMSALVSTSGVGGLLTVTSPAEGRL